MSVSIPTVTLGLPVYNGGRYLRHALDACLQQTFGDFELLISDNASTDDTEAIGRAYARQDPRVRYVRQKTNVGAAANFNDVFYQARGRYFKWVAHDDIIAPTFLERCVSALDADPSAVLAYSLIRLIDEEGHFTGDQSGTGRTPVRNFAAPAAQQALDPIARYRSVLLHTVWCFEVFGLIRTAALRRSSLIADYYGSDRVLLAELSLQGRFHQVREELFFRRCHPAQSSTDKSPREQNQWIKGRSSTRFVFPQWHLFTGYLSALQRDGLSPADQVRGAGAILRLATRPDKLKRFIVPGPYNYFGIRGRSARAAHASS